jgi:hypothetical protein
MEDPRCCGSGTCIINPQGLCWCGQRWDGTRMCAPEPLDLSGADEAPPAGTPPNRPDEPRQDTM